MITVVIIAQYGRRSTNWRADVATTRLLTALDMRNPATHRLQQCNSQLVRSVIVSRDRS